MSMQDSIAAVGCFTREGKPRALAVKLCVPCNQLLNAVRREKALRRFEVQLKDGEVQVNIPN